MKGKYSPKDMFICVRFSICLLWGTILLKFLFLLGGSLCKWRDHACWIKCLNQRSSVSYEWHIVTVTSKHSTCYMLIHLFPDWTIYVKLVRIVNKIKWVLSLSSSLVKVVHEL